VVLTGDTSGSLEHGSAAAIAAKIAAKPGADVALAEIEQLA